MSNVINKFVQTIPATLSNDNIKIMLETVLNELERVYSYLIYAKYKDNKLINWQIQYNISQTDEYNTLNADTVIIDIYKSILESKENKVASVIGHKQPPLELMIKVYEPLIKHLATVESKHWKQLEYDDCYQICLMTMFNLYRKNYYIHKTLLERSYRNAILKYVSKDKYKPEFISIQTILNIDDDNVPVTIADQVPDTKSATIIEEDEIIQTIFNEVTDILEELIGERQLEQLVREYGNKHTTSWSRKKMSQLKAKFAEMGITWNSFKY